MTSNYNFTVSDRQETAGIGREQVRLELTIVPVVNYALQQNGVPFVQSITIQNNGSSALENVKIRVTSDSGVVLPYESAVEYIPGGRSYEIKNLPVSLNAEFLAGITERIKDRLTVSLFRDEALLAGESAEITVLAFDEWHGSGYYPELLSAFVTPNHPMLGKIISRAAELLKSWTYDPSMDAYQTQDPNRVLSQAAAIFNAIKEERIVYSVPPASFESVGQRVRLCDAVLQQRFGTCLDLTLLYASCLEAIGLHPILVLTKGHIFSGVWLDALSFPEAIQDDPSVLTKRLAAGVNEIAVIETTFLVNGKNATFDDAREAAEHALIGTEPIEYLIDVYRARVSGILPLPQRVHTGDGWHVEQHYTVNDPIRSAAPKALDSVVDLDADAAEQNDPKLMQWERKLLDLGMRNNLINLRFSKTLVPLLASSLDDLEDALSDGSDFSILPRPADWQMPEGGPGFETTHDLGQYVSVIQAEFTNKRLRSLFTESELARTVKELYRASKTALEENGANTLYLALGLLRWYESPRSTKPRYAPIVLIPVEIIRKSANSGYMIRLRDDEPQMNITVLEKIKQDFGITVTGVDPLPADDHGVDLRRVFTILRKSIMEQPRWDVLESAYLGIFSFSQFVMWNDLRSRADDLLKNKVVKSLVDGKLAWDAKPMEIGERVPEDHVLLPMSADASQLFAIEAACDEESFVLHGPPGTGKSQTITSLIANALAQGKSVLFVAEKMAALEVVQRRLENIGIGPFCLELHSNKSKKKDVLEQLRRVSEVTKYQSAEQYAAKAEQIAKLRAGLDDYAEKLHEIQPFGYTLHELIDEYERYKSAPDVPAFSRDYVEYLDRGALDENVTILERLIAAGKSVGHPHNHPLSPVGVTSYTQQLRADLPGRINAYKSALQDISGPVRDFSFALLTPDIFAFTDIERLYLIAKELDQWFAFPKAWAKIGDLDGYLTGVGEMAAHFAKANELKSVLAQNWNESFLAQSGEELLTEYNTLSDKRFLSKAIGSSQLSKKLASFSIGKVDKSGIGQAIVQLFEYQIHQKAADELFTSFGRDLGELCRGKDTDWQKILTLSEAAKISGGALAAITGGDDFRKAFCGEDPLKKMVGDLLEKYPPLLDAKIACYDLLQMDETKAGSNWISEQITVCEDILSNADQLKEWISFNIIAEEAINAGLGGVARAYREGMSHDDLLPAYQKAILYALCVLTIDENESISAFSGAVFNERIEQYKRVDRELIELTQKEIYCRLASKVPNFVSAAAQSSEIGILQRMIKSGGRGTTIRKLFEDISNLLPRLCPCMLMSPISAAQYLDPKREPFDIVVFDEASQLPTCKAVGVMARGRNAVIVGDPKQMPPTAFFATNTVDEDNLEIEDLESILDDCLALGMPQTHLLWHYRSRHESLIAFSNHHFYENKLYTFPSVNDRESKVSLVRVDGVFERGKARQNRAEAEAVIAEIKRRCHDPELSKESVGVVTFNISQQHLIDDLLSEACEKDSELEKWAYDSDEPLFIKNLENVQGDERDVILFSIGYGPDQNGRVSMNFGPLNRDGGWRRLNVAVSRARSEMIVYSTITPDQIDLSRTSAEGVAALKAFLEYASGRELALAGESSGQYRQSGGIVKTIRDFLKAAGFDTDVSVGHSEYRIDIGVVDPENPGRYMLGILLDGPCYGTSRTTRDREIAQISVLSGLGWEIARVWTMDWWDNSKKELDRILSILKGMQKGEEEQPAAEVIPVETANTGVLASNVSLTKQASPVRTDYEVIAYQAADLRNRDLSAEDFVSGLYDREIEQSVRLVMKSEAPISFSLLTKRVVQSFGIARSGSRIQDYLYRMYTKLGLEYTLQDEYIFYWNKDQTPESYPFIRADEGDDKRDTRDVPPVEAMNAVCYVLEQQVSLSDEDLIRESAKLMGYTRMGNIVVSLFSGAIRQAQKSGKIKQGTNGNWVLV